MKKIELVAEENCRRLDVFLAENAGLTRSHAQKLVEQGCVTVDGKVVKKNAEVKENNVVSATLPDEISLDVLPQDIPLDIVFQDS